MPFLPSLGHKKWEKYQTDNFLIMPERILVDLCSNTHLLSGALGRDGKNEITATKLVSYLKESLKVGREGKLRKQF